MSDLVGNPKDWLSHDTAHYKMKLPVKKNPASANCLGVWVMVLGQLVNDSILCLNSSYSLLRGAGLPPPGARGAPSVRFEDPEIIPDHCG